MYQAISTSNLNRRFGLYDSLCRVRYVRTMRMMPVGISNIADIHRNRIATANMHVEKLLAGMVEFLSIVCQCLSTFDETREP